MAHNTLYKFRDLAVPIAYEPKTHKGFWLWFGGGMILNIVVTCAVNHVMFSDAKLRESPEITSIVAFLNTISAVSYIVYFLPCYLARKNQNLLSVTLLDLFLGWTGIGWLIALIWAVQGRARKLSPQEADAYQKAALITAPQGTAAPAAQVVTAPPPPSPVVTASPPPNPASVSQAIQIYIHRNGQPFGPYSEHDIRRYIAQGRLRLTDLAWHNGVTTWVPVSTVLQNFI